MGADFSLVPFEPLKTGVWSLWVVDDTITHTGSIAGGWSLTFTVPAVFTVNSTNDPGDGTCNAMGGTQC